MTLNANGRATEVTPPGDGQGASPTTPHQQDNYPRPMGATPYTPADPQDMGTDAALEQMRYEDMRFILGWVIS